MIYFITNQQKLHEDKEIKLCGIIDCIRYFENKDIIEVDTETEYCTWDKEKDPQKRRLPDPYTSKVLSLQLGDKYNQFVIDCATVDFITYVKPLFEDKNKIKIFTNAFFDLRFIFHWGIKIKNVCDIFLQEMVLTRGKSLPKGYRSLDGMTQRYLNIKLNKDVRGQIHWRGLDTTVVKYAAEDVAYMGLIRNEQIKKLKALNLLNYANLENRYVISLAKTSYKGFKINVDKWKEVEKYNKELFIEYQQKLDDWVIENMPKYSEVTLFDTRCTIKWTSSDQVKPLMKDLNIDTEVIDKKTNKTKDSVELKLLKKQINKSELLPIYIKFKELSKEITTYGSAFLEKNINPVTGRVHSEFFQILETGRISSNKPNIQNIPGELDGETHPLRKAFTPEEGNYFIINDYSQQEPRITADYSGDEYLKDFILNGSGDSHGLIATMISEYLLGEHVEVTKQNNPYVKQYGKSIRAIGKTINLGKDYGKSAFTTAPDLGISVEEAESLFNIIDSKTPQKIEYFKKWQKFAEKYGFIITDDLVYSRTWFSDYEEYYKLKNIQFKTKEQFKRFSRLKGELERFAQNNRIQGSAALMTKIAHIYIDDELERLGLDDIVYIVALIHDEIATEAPKELADKIAKIKVDSMIKAGKLFCKTIPMKVDPEIGEEWSH